MNRGIQERVSAGQRTSPRAITGLGWSRSVILLGWSTLTNQTGTFPSSGLRRV